MEKESIVAPVQIVLDAGAAARQLVTSEMQCHPGYADLHNRLGLLDVWEGRPDRAARSFREALGINPGYFWAASNLAFALVGSGHHDEALEFFSPHSVIAAAKEFPAVRAALLLEAGQPRAGLELLDQDDEDAGPYHYHARGLAHLALSDAAAAQKAFRLASRDCGPLERLYRQRELTGPGSLEKVSPRRAASPIRVFPGMYELQDFFAEIYARHGFRNRALQSHEEGQVLWPDRSRHAWNMGRLASWMGDSEEAKACFLEAIAFNQDSVEAQLALGMEYSGEGQTHLAIQQLERAADLRPGYADIRYQLGLSYVDAGRFGDAVEAFRAALSINPSFSFARLNLALALRRNEQRKDAIREYERLLAEGRATADLYMNLGIVYLEEGEAVRAEDLFREGIEINPDFHLNYYYLGMACQRQGRRPQARTAWKQFLDRHRESELAAEVQRRLKAS